MRSRTGLRQRLLTVILPIAALAVVLSALVTQAITKDQLQAQSAASQAAVVDINQTLNEFAVFASSWSEADDVVTELSERYSVRIALTDLDGQILVDTAANDAVGEHALPAQSAGFIDPSIEAFNIEAPVEITSVWLADAAYQDCLIQAGIDQRFLEDVDIPVADACLAQVFAEYPDSVVSSSVLSEVNGPSNSEPTGTKPSGDDPGEVELSIPLSGPDMLPSAEPASAEPAPVNGDLPESGLLSDLTSVQDPFSAGSRRLAPALLFLGEAGQPLNVLDATFDYRMMLSIATIALAAIAGTYILARRILSPISALTAAAHQVAAGGKPEPIPVVGDSELSDLASAFNSMGDALREEELARRQLTTDIAHELRSPLQNIRGTLEAAQDGIRKLDLGLVNSVHEEALILQHLVDDLQILALADAANLQMRHDRVPVNDLLLGATRSHADRAVGKGVELLTEELQNDVAISGDPIRLHQILTNLIDNAIRHTPSGGTVTVSAVVLPSEFIDENDLPLCLTVSDNGDGIPEDFVPHVFDRFSRADSSRARGTGGSGVGLAICQKLTEAHGGTIEVVSEIGVGTTFLVRLPLIGEAAT